MPVIATAAGYVLAIAAVAGAATYWALQRLRAL
jgi:hypothetical protein